MKKTYYTTLSLITLLIAVLLAGCGGPKNNSYKRDFFAMDTYITCQVLTDDKALAEAGLDSVEKAFLEIDQLTNRFSEGSDVFTVNEKAGLAPVKVSEEVFTIAETALAWSDRTNGAFNILIGGVMDLWGFGTEKPTVPLAADVAAALNRTDYQQIVLDAAQSTIFLPEKGMALDFGGVAKGYATDKAVAALKELGIGNAIINAGGNVYALGNRADGTPWRVGVQDPQHPKEIMGLLRVSDAAVVSSGDYQRYFEANGVRYHHILDPATGQPARASAGTTVIMKSATVADILSTALFVKGPAEGISLAEQLPQVEAAMILTRDGGVYGTKSLTGYLAGQ